MHGARRLVILPGVTIAPIRRVLRLGSLCLAVSSCGDDDVTSGSSRSSEPESAPEHVQSAAEVQCSGLSWTEEAAAFEDEVLRLVNEQREAGATCGGQQAPPVPALEFDATLLCTARAHSRDMLEQGYFGHDSQDGRRPSERIEDAGYQFSLMGENIASGQPTPEAVMDSWMRSPDHCENIMNGRFIDAGIGYDTAGQGQHVWTQNFGAPR